MLQTQKKDIKEKREYWKRKNEEYRNKKKDGFNILREWVPGTKYLTRIQLLKKTVNYIQELLNKIKELETSQKDMGRDSVPKITVHHYATEQDSALREPQTSPTDTSEMADLRTGPSPTDHSVILKSLRNKILGTGASEEKSDILQESLLPEELPEFNTVEDLREWLGLSMDEMTPSEVLSPEEEMKLLESGQEFNWTEDLRRCLEL
jgi:hypothetical protein